MPLTNYVEVKLGKGEWIKAERPGHFALMMAREKKAEKQLEWYRRVQPLMEAVAKDEVAQQAAATEVAKPKDPLDDYDIQTLLEFCVASWSYEEPVNAKNIQKLSEETARKVALAVLPKVDDEAAAKND